MQIMVNISKELYETILNLPDFISATATQAIRDGIPLPKGHGTYGCKIPEGFDSSPAIEALNGLPSVTPQPKMGCEGCTYEKTGNNSTYPCSHCSRCYTDKYKAESEVSE